MNLEKGFEKIKSTISGFSKSELNLPSVCNFKISNSLSPIISGDVSFDQITLVTGNHDSYIDLWETTEGIPRLLKPSIDIAAMSFDSGTIFV